MNLSIVALFLFVSPAWADVQTQLDPKDGNVEFHAVGRPSMLKITGKGTGPRGTLTVRGAQVSGDFHVDLKDVTTGIDMRDTHMKEKYLQIDKYPQAEFKLTRLTLPQSLDGKDANFKELPFSGTFKVHGVEKPVSGTADVSVASSKLTGTAQFSIKISDYQIEIPKFAGITVAEDVQVIVQGNGALTEAAAPIAPEPKAAPAPKKKAEPKKKTTAQKTTKKGKKKK